MSWTSPFLKIDHVQLAIPENMEERAREFYLKVLGFAEIPKPETLAGRGGLWLESGEAVIHLGVDSDFHAAHKAHPALICRNYPVMVQHLQDAGFQPIRDESIPGVTRCHVFDPFGNRLELIAAR